MYLIHFYSFFEFDIILIYTYILGEGRALCSACERSCPQRVQRLPAQQPLRVGGRPAELGRHGRPGRGPGPPPLPRRLRGLQPLGILMRRGMS